MEKPVYIEDYLIYDIFHNDNNNLVLICPAEKNGMIISYKDIKLHKYTCPLGLTFVYVLDQQTNYEPRIVLRINGLCVETDVKKYPVFENEIIMSTIVCNEDDYIKQWINFHSKLGITRFIIYDNSSLCTLEAVLCDYIKNGTVLLIKWPYAYRMKKSGISGQATQQVHSIWAFKRCKYIGLFDVDEYVNMQSERNLHSFFDNIIKDENVETKNLGSFKLLNKSFYNPDNLPTDGINFLKIYNCDTITRRGREKNFVIPRNVCTFSVHKITQGKPMYTVVPEKVYFNHYLFLNKEHRGREKAPHKDNSILKHIV
jgi:hypothetical protein